MDQWEYIDLVIKAEEGIWAATFSGGGKLLGMEAILNYFGSIGWELVSLTPTSYERRFRAFEDYISEATAFLAVFKRHKPAIVDPYSLPPQG